MMSPMVPLTVMVRAVVSLMPAILGSRSTVLAKVMTCFPSPSGGESVTPWHSLPRQLPKRPMTLPPCQSTWRIVVPSCSSMIDMLCSWSSWANTAGAPSSWTYAWRVKRKLSGSFGAGQSEYDGMPWLPVTTRESTW